MLRSLLSPLVLFFVAFIIALHQWLYWGAWFELKDIHHEMFIAMFAFAGFVLLLWRKGKVL